MKARHLFLPLVALGLMGQAEPFPVPVEIESWIDMTQLPFDSADGRRTTHYELTVTDRGRASTCRVTQSSGDREFDLAGCKQLRKSARFERTPSGMFKDIQRHYRGYFFADPPR